MKEIPLVLTSRIAPTPSGFLHIGNAFNFILTWLIVRKNRGRLLLRIDDIDFERKKEAFVADIFEQLDWLQVDYDMGPQSVSDFEKNWSQLHQLEHYQAVLQQLRQHPCLYATLQSRKDFLRHTLPVQTDLDTPNCTWRMCIPLGTKVGLQTLCEEQPIGCSTDNLLRDTTLRKRNGFPAYQLVSVVEDVRWRINCIVRGADLFPSTVFQVWLSQQLGKPYADFQHTFFAHHLLLKDHNQQKLSKSAGATALFEWRRKYQQPRLLYQLVATYLQLPDVADIQTIADLLAVFEMRQLRYVCSYEASTP